MLKRVSVNLGASSWVMSPLLDRAGCGDTPETDGALGGSGCGDTPETDGALGGSGCGDTPETDGALGGSGASGALTT